MAADEQSWVQWAVGSLGALWAGSSLHLYVLGSTRSKAVHARIDEAVRHVEENYVRKDVLAESIRGFSAVQAQATEDHRIMAERIEDIARDLHILMGRTTGQHGASP